MPKRLIRRRFNIRNPKERDLKKSEKGLSTIVATLLIILVTIVAVGIIWVVIRNVIQNGAEQISLGKITLDLKISQIRITSYTDVNVTVKRNSGRGEFSGIVFVAYDESNSEMIRKNVSLNELESRNFQVTLSVVNTSKIKKISIAPVFTLASGKQVVGDIKDEYIFNSKNSIIQVCVSDCPSGAQCGIDSCGKDCGTGCTNPNFPICSNYQCAAQTCIPNCPTGAQCGYDGCTGTCGTCPSLPNSISQCNAGYQCEIQSCIFGYDNCDLNTANGCEVNLQTNNTNCGSCGHSCLTGETCTAGVCIGCVPTTFNPALNTFCGSQSVTTNCGNQILSGIKTCTLPTVCGGMLGFPNACGCTATIFTPTLESFCGNKLIDTNCASGILYSGALQCTSPEICGGSGTPNACGCTATTFSPALNTFCGSQSVTTNCGNQNLAGVLNCINPHGSTSCSSGLCQPICSSNYGNCDSNNANGCEQSLADIFNCGACNNFCSLPGATATCTTGSCSISSCNSGYGNCDSNTPNGCETNTNTNISNCGLCGTACTNIHGSTSCSSGLCQPVCSSNYGNCDSNNVNGCEQSLSSLLDCGSCSNLCLPSNAVASCSTGSCLISSCNSGYGNCDSNNVNGCETNINTNVSNCGLCGTACTNIHGSTSCSSGLCQPVCSSNYGSCDSNNVNGCETSLTSPIDCGVCGVPCMLSNAAATCTTGSCLISSCSSGYGNCDSNTPNGCETNINTNFSNCGSCNHACTTGQTCSGGTCVNSGSGNIYYINTTGSDSSGTGTASSPWKTLYKACSTVTTSGSTIHVGSGTFTETQQCFLRPGINIQGEGNEASIITSTSFTAYITPIVSLSSSPTVSGDQTISYLKFDGANSVASEAVDIKGRNNVKIHHCKFVNFNHIAVGWTTSSPTDNSEPNPYITGSEFYNNNLTNCAGSDGYGTYLGALFLGGQDGMLIHDNYFLETAKGNGQGWPIKFWYWNGWSKGVKIYNNYIKKTSFSTWDFALEINNTMGMEIYNNTIVGGIDMNHQTKSASYPYSVYIHNNTIGPDNFVSGNPLSLAGITLEFNNEDVLIEKNIIANSSPCILFTPRAEAETNVTIRYNICSKVRTTGYYTEGITTNPLGNGHTINGLYIYNNVIEGTAGSTDYGIRLVHAGGSAIASATNIKIINNIILNFNGAYFYLTGASAFSNLFVQNNVLYNNGNSNGVLFTGTPTSYTNSGNNISDPLFVNSAGGNFHLNSGSKAINAGINLGLTSDFEENSISGLPDIGAYEYAGSSSGTTYYVNYSGGNDAWAGTSSSTAWKTIAKVNSKTFLAGDQILFARGETWRDMLAVPSSGNSANYITLGAYGVGNKPKIYGSNVSTGWVSAGPNVWKSTTTFAVNPSTVILSGSAFPSEIFFEYSNGSVFWGSNLTSGSLTREYQWNWTSNYIYVYSPSGNPASVYSSVEIPQRISAINIGDTNQYIAIDGLDLRYATAINLFDNNPPSSLTGFILKNSHLGYVGSRDQGSGYNLAVVRNNMLIQNNEIENGGRRLISVHLYDTSSSTFSNFTIEGNYLHEGYHGSGIGMNMDGVGTSTSDVFQNIIVRNNMFYDSPDRNPTVDGMDPTEQCTFRVEQTGGIIKNIQVYNNIFMYPTGEGLLFQNINNATAYNNVFYDTNHNPSGLGYSLQLWVSSGSTAVNIKNNIFYIASLRSTVHPNSIYIEANQPTSGVSVDYNLFYSTTGSVGLVNIGSTGRLYGASSDYTWSQLKTDISGWQAHEPGLVDPLFVNPTNKDFHLQPTSKAIWNGTSIVGLTTDYAGVNYKNPPSIGAYEFTGTVSSGNIYYINTTGSDSAGTGNALSPWKTLYKACSTVTTSGSTIHVGPGIFTETQQCNLAVGVSIQGEGDQVSIISTTYSTAYESAIKLSSTTQGTNGNQDISYIKMDGNSLTAWSAIMVLARGNVQIHHCTFVNFNNAGIYFSGTNSIFAGPPTTYATGNKFYSNTITNCASYPSGDGQGNLMIGGQDGIDIYNNTITAIARATTNNGYNIKFCADGYNKAFRIHDNVLKRLIGTPTSSYYDFSIELWHTQGGAQIYNNSMSGGIDFGGGITYKCLEKGSYNYGARVYNNSIGYDITTVLSGTTGIYLEDNTDSAIIEKNTFKNQYNGIFMTPNSGETSKNHKISYNIFNGIGYYGIRYTYGVNSGGNVSNLSIYNNVFYVGSNSGNLVGIGIPSVGTTSYVNVTNNIIYGTKYSAILGCTSQGQTLDYINLQNNIFYQNSGTISGLDTATNYVHSGDILTNPLFVSDGTNFHLQSTSSPAYNAGLNVGLTSDFEGISVPQGSAPDIGAFEYP